MASSTSAKVLAVGSAVGSFKDLFAKVKAIDAKHGKFDFVLCVGDFFGPGAGPGETDEIESLLKDEIEAPIPCYVMQGDHPVPQPVIEKFAVSGSEICKNVFLMSKSGLLTTSHGLRIACLGGKFDETAYDYSNAPLGFSDPYFSSQTVEKLLANMSSSSTSSTSKSQSLAALAQSSPSSHLIDILISNVWPAAILKHSSVTPPASDDVNHIVQQVDDVVRRAKPKYHFVSGCGEPSQFWEREPFVWDEDDGRASRFIALGAFGGNHGTVKKPRWFYAFSISSSHTTQQRPANATTNPFTTASTSSSQKRPFETSDSQNFIFGNVQQPTKRPRQEKREGGKPPEGYKCRKCESTEHFISDCPERTKPPDGYVCKVCNVPGHLIRDCPEKNASGDTGGRKPPPGYVCRACASEGHLIQDCPVAAQSQRGPRGRDRGPPKEIAPGQCWFCLSNPSIAKHLIVSIGAECYLTLPKGQIIPTGDYARDSGPGTARVPGGGHVLIVPMAHYPTLSATPPDVATPILDEIAAYKVALRSLYAKHGCVPVVYEVSILSGKGGHAHVQVVPVPSKLKDRVEDAIVDEGKLSGVTFEDDPDAALQSCSGGNGNYFSMELPDGKKLVHIIKQSVPFSIQFGRQALCKFLDMPERLDWKLCAQSDSEEKDDADAFKRAFAPFDTTQG